MKRHCGNGGTAPRILIDFIYFQFCTCPIATDNYTGVLYVCENLSRKIFSWDDSLADHEIPYLSWNPKFLTVFTRARHWSLSWVTWIPSTTSYPIFRRSILILYSILCLHVTSSLFPSDFRTKISYKFLVSPCTLHLILLILITLTILFQEYRLRTERSRESTHWLSAQNCLQAVGNNERETYVTGSFRASGLKL